MKLLFDENLSPRLVAYLADIFPDSIHVHSVGLGSLSDREVWDYAREHSYTLVSKDSDFHELSLLHELVLVDFESKQQKSADYMKLNPSGMVPTLIVDGAPRTECAALLMLVAERHPQAELVPTQGTPARSDYLQWMLFFANTLQPAYRAWFYPHEPAGETNVGAVKAQATSHYRDGAASEV